MITSDSLKISIAIDFSMTPGHRYRRMGPDSGEEFYETLLKPKLKEAIRKNKQLILDMDGTEGLSGGFRDEVFLRVGADFGDKLPIQKALWILKN